MKIAVDFDNYETGIYQNLEEVNKSVSICHADGVGVVRIYEVDENGEEIEHAKEYGVEWVVNIVEL